MGYDGDAVIIDRWRRLDRRVRIVLFLVALAVSWYVVYHLAIRYGGPYVNY